MYLKKSTLMQEYDTSLSTIDAKLKFIRQQIGKRYPVGAICHTGKLIRIRDDVFQDAMMFSDAVDAGLAPRFVPHEKHVWEVNEA